MRRKIVSLEKSVQSWHHLITLSARFSPRAIVKLIRLLTSGHRQFEHHRPFDGNVAVSCSYLNLVDDLPCAVFVLF
jgi:hypothetical protein